MLKDRLRILTSLLIFVLLYGCAKKNEPDQVQTPPLPNDCRMIASYMYNSTDTLRREYFTYNANNQLTQIKWIGNLAPGTDSLYIYLSYSGNQIFRFIDVGAYSTWDTTTLNAAGLVVTRHARSLENGLNDQVYQEMYRYNERNELLNLITLNGVADTTSVASYTYTNGDVTSVSSGTDVTTYAYDLTKFAVHGNNEEYQQMMFYGARSLNSKHLAISETTSRHIYRYAYTFDVNGNIATSTLTYEGSGPVTTGYSYSCK